MAQKPELKIVYVDRPELFETFSDSAEKVSFDGTVWRIEFCVTRLEESKPPIVSGKRHPACRMVLTANAGLQLYDRLKGLVSVLEKRGMLRQKSIPDLVVPPVGKPS